MKIFHGSGKKFPEKNVHSISHWGKKFTRKIVLKKTQNFTAEKISWYIFLRVFENQVKNKMFFTFLFSGE